MDFIDDNKAQIYTSITGINVPETNHDSIYALKTEKPGVIKLESLLGPFKKRIATYQTGHSFTKN